MINIMELNSQINSTEATKKEKKAIKEAKLSGNVNEKEKQEINSILNF